MAKKDVIDFSGVGDDTGGRYRHVPPGDYLVKIDKVEKKWKDDDKSNVHYYKWRFVIMEPAKSKGSAVSHNTSLSPEALWNLRNLILAATGKNVAGKRVGFEPSTIIGKQVMVTLDDREYNGKMYNDVADIQPKSAWGASDDEDEEEEDTEEEDEDEELDEVDIDEDL